MASAALSTEALIMRASSDHRRHPNACAARRQSISRDVGRDVPSLTWYVGRGRLTALLRNYRVRRVVEVRDQRKPVDTRNLRPLLAPESHPKLPLVVLTYHVASGEF